MQILIPLPAGKHVSGESRHGRWIVGDYFNYYAFDGLREYQFLGIDRVGGLHARRTHDQQLVVFESSNEWQNRTQAAIAKAEGKQV